MQDTNTFISAHTAAIAGLIQAGIGWHDLGYESEAHLLALPVIGTAVVLALVCDDTALNQCHQLGTVNGEITGNGCGNTWAVFCLGFGWIKLPDCFNAGITRSSIPNFPERSEWHAGISGKLVYFCMAKPLKKRSDFGDLG